MIGVDAEVVGPGASAVARVVLGSRGPAGEVVEPVVERAQACQEPDRRRGQGADRDDRLPVPGRVVAAQPAEEDDDAGADGEEEPRHPDRAHPAGPEGPAPPAGARRRGRRVRRRVLGLDLRHRLPPPSVDRDEILHERVDLLLGQARIRLRHHVPGYPSSHVGIGLDDRLAHERPRAACPRAGPALAAPRGSARSSRWHSPPRSAWQLPQPFCANTAAPAFPPPPVCCPASRFQVVELGLRGSRSRPARMTEWPRPQSSVQSTSYSPIFVGVIDERRAPGPEQVLLLAELRHPERVEDVARRACARCHGHVDGQVKLARAEAALGDTLGVALELVLIGVGRVGRRVEELPGELTADDVHDHVVVGQLVVLRRARPC